MRSTVLCVALLSAGCGSATDPASIAGPTPIAPHHVCTQIYHPKETQYLGWNRWVQIPAWTETVCEWVP